MTTEELSVELAMARAEIAQLNEFLSQAHWELEQCKEELREMTEDRDRWKGLCGSDV